MIRLILAGCLLALICDGSKVWAQTTVIDESNYTAFSTDPDAVFDESYRAMPEPWSIDGQTPYIQQFGLGYRYGDGVGFQNGYVDLEWVVPIRGDAPFDNFFADMHLLMLENAQVAGNALLAYRRYNRDWNRILGGYVGWDGTQTPLGNQLQQLTMGVESLGPILDFRSNLYIPDRFNIRASLPNIFVGNNLIVNRAEVAMTGIDAEVGLNLPVFLNTRSRVLAGVYNFDGNGPPGMTGWKVRAEAEYNRQLWWDISFQDDKLFGQTWNMALTWRYAHRFLNHSRSPATMDHKYYRAEDVDADNDLSDRLSDPIRRLQKVVITRDPGVVATNTTGTPLEFLHVANGFAGTGTFENPYGTLTAALADASAGTATIYTPYGGTYNENINLVSGATVLSNGPTQTVETQFGNQVLPFSGSHTNLTGLPSLTGNVTMAGNSRFSGFDVTGQISASAVTGFTIDNSVVNNAAGDAISITGATASTLTNLKLTSGAGSGLNLNDSSATITDLQVTSATTNGLQVTTTATARTVSVNNLTVNAAGQHGVDLNVTGAGALSYTQTGTNTITSTGNAFDAALAAASTGNMNLSMGSYTVASTAGAGVNLDGSAGTGKLNLLSMTSGTITKAATGGFLADTVTFDNNLTTVGIQQIGVNSLTIGSSSDTTQIKGDGIRLIDTTGSLLVSNLNVFNDTGTGILVDTTGGGTVFTLATAAGQISTTNGPAINLNTLTTSLTLGSIKSVNSPTEGVMMNAVTGTLTSVSTTINGSIGKSIRIMNTTSPLSTAFGATSIHSTIGPTQADNVDTTTGNGANLTISFNPLSITFP